MSLKGFRESLGGDEVAMVINEDGGFSFELKPAVISPHSKFAKIASQTDKKSLGIIARAARFERTVLEEFKHNFDRRRALRLHRIYCVVERDGGIDEIDEILSEDDWILDAAMSFLRIRRIEQGLPLMRFCE